MSDYNDSNRHTFLSRVLGTSTTTNDSPRKTGRVGGAGGGLLDLAATTTDTDNKGPFQNDDKSEVILQANSADLQFSNGYNYTDGNKVRNLIMSEVSLNDRLRSGKKKRANLEINFNSESEEESSDNESQGEVLQNAGLSKSEENKIKHELETELDLNVDNEFDPESLLDRYHQGGSRNNFFSKIEESVVFQVREAERNLGPKINNLTERARHLAQKTIENSMLLHQEPTFISNRAPNTATNTTEQRRRQVFNARKLPPMERARWMWANVTNLDVFLNDVYEYYVENGWLCMALQRVSDLLIIVFVVWLTSFLGNCIDYKIMFNENVNKLSKVYIDHCYAKIPLTQKLFNYLLLFLLAMKAKNSYKELMDLREIKLFYNYLLDIDDSELQTISWPQIVKKIMILKGQNTNAIVNADQDYLRSKEKLNAHDIANRLMRKENYMIAMFNRNVINKALRVPLFRMQFLTKTLEWNLKLCILDYLFNEQGQLKSKALSQHHRLSLITKLKKRFRIAGLLGIFISPFMVFYFIMYYFLKLFYDFKTNPGLLNARSYSPYAKWKMREYNELPHLFEQRINLSIEHADNYLTNFPKELTNIVLKFVAFISGSIVTILAILTIIDHENFLNFEITEGRTTLFYMSTLGALFTVCKNSISDTNTKYLFDSETSLKKMAEYTHYLPASWENRYHTVEVKNQFCNLYNLKLYLIFKELCSLVFLPYILYFSLPNSCDKIIDFFRDYSVHVDGIGYVCSFAMFNLEENKDKIKAGVYLSDDANDKMMKSYIHFVESYSGNDNNRTDDERKQRVFQNPTHNLLRKNTGNNDLLKSALLNNKRNFGNGGTSKGNGLDTLREKTSDNAFKDSNIDLAMDLNNSMLLGESFQMGYARQNKNKSKYQNVEVDHDEDELSNSANGGVLGLLNQVYKYK